MKRFRFCITLLCIAVAGSVLFSGSAHCQNNVPRMTKEELKSLIGNPDVMVIDVRSQGDWNKEKEMIKGAVREDPIDVTSWMEKYPKDKTLVFYCS